MTPCGQGEAAFVLAQGLGGQVEGHERRRAGGVDGEGRAFEAEGVRDAAGDDGRGPCSGHVGLDGLRHAFGEVAVVLDAGAHVDADAAAAQGLRVDPGPFEGFPGDFEAEALLRVGGLRLHGADPEEPGVEVARAFEESALVHVAGSRLRGVVAHELVEVPAAVVRHARYGVAALCHQLPQLLGGGHPAGEAAAHGHDRDGLLRGGLGVLEAAPGAVQVGGHLFEVVEDLLVVGHIGLTVLRGQMTAGVR